MTSHAPRPAAVELILARLLSGGTWIACMVIAIGIVLQVTGHADSGARLDRVGIGLFVLLPVARLITLAVAFARAREKVFVGVCLLILLIIALGTIVSLTLRSAALQPRRDTGHMLALETSPVELVLAGLP
jgi:uncharacterized membrane protein